MKHALRFTTLLAGTLSLLTGCATDPFDPLLGPRNPTHGAASALADIPEVSAADQAALLASKPCSVRLLRLLKTSPSREVRALVAANPSADEAILTTLASDSDSAVRQYAAGNPRLPRGLLKQIATDSDETVRGGTAANPRWTASEIRHMHLQKTAAPSVIARNPSAPPDVLKELTYTSDYNVLTALALNPSIPPYVVNRLANDPSPSVRLILVSNQKSLPRATLERLSKDADARISRTAKEWLAQKHR